MSTGPFGDGSFGTQVFSNTPFYDTKTLIDAVLRNTGHSTPASETAKRAVCLDFLNNRYSVITTMQHWDWLYQEVDFLFKEPYSDGTISLTKGSQTVIGAGTAWDVNAVPNNVLYIPSRNETYLISTIDAAGSMTIEGQYAGEDETEVSYQIIKPIYTCPSDLETIQAIQVDGVGKLVPLGRQEFIRIKQSMPGQVGMPRCFTEVGRRSQDGVRLVEIYPAPDKNYTSRFHYGVNIQRLSDEEDNYPLIPDRHRAILYYGALSDMFAYLRDATMSDKYEGIYQLAVTQMRNDTKITDSKIQFQPKRNYKNRSNKRSSYRRSYTASQFASEDE